MRESKAEGTNHARKEAGIEEKKVRINKQTMEGLDGGVQMSVVG